MNEKIAIKKNLVPLKVNNEYIRNALHDFNVKMIGKEKEFSFFAHDEAGKIVGGLIVYAEKSSIFIDILWVSDKLRNCGVGSRLIAAAEDEGRKLGIQYSTTDTFAFQAVDFYKKNGYQEIGVIKEYIEGHDKIFFRKNISENRS